MSTVEIYSHPSCSYCHQAKRLLNSHGVEYQELDLAKDERLRKEMQARTGGRTIPQIVIDGKPIGGFQELVTVIREKKHPLFN